MRLSECIGMGPAAVWGTDFCVYFYLGDFTERKRGGRKVSESEDARFRVVGIRKAPILQMKPEAAVRHRRIPLFSMAVLGMILFGCLFFGPFLEEKAVYMELGQAFAAPDFRFWFGTDTMGRDIFSMIWYGGRISLVIGFLATLISTGIAVVLGTVSGLAPGWMDAVLMRFTETFLSIPGLLLTVFFQAACGKTTVVSLSFVIGLAGWPAMAKVVRARVRQLKGCEFVIASKCMGGGFFHILRQHLAPNFFSSILFMMVMNIRSAIAAESTLSFMGIGLPLEIISWGSMLSLSGQALLSGAWWMIVIPGGFLAATLLCVTEIADAVRRRGGEMR